MKSKELINRAGSERALISICLQNPEELVVASSLGLLPEMFAVDGHKYIYMAMQYLYSKGEQLDPISIMNVYTDENAKEAIEELGGIEYIEALKATPVAKKHQALRGTHYSSLCSPRGLRNCPQGC
jgi:Replicative DNA helicase